MNDDRFNEIRQRLERGSQVWIQIGSGKYNGSVSEALDTKIYTSYYDDDKQYKYEDMKIKFKINGRALWLVSWGLQESSQKSENIVTKSIKNKTRTAPKDFLDREFSIDDVVFLHSSTYGEILGVIDKINDKGTLTIRLAKKRNEGWESDQVKQGIFMVPYNRANRILIIDDPAILLLRA